MVTFQEGTFGDWGHIGRSRRPGGYGGTHQLCSRSLELNGTITAGPVARSHNQRPSPARPRPGAARPGPGAARPEPGAAGLTSSDSETIP